VNALHPAPFLVEGEEVPEKHLHPELFYDPIEAIPLSSFPDRDVAS
jgi:hypothetical protein